MCLGREERRLTRLTTLGGSLDRDFHQVPACYIVLSAVLGRYDFKTNGLIIFIFLRLL